MPSRTDSESLVRSWGFKTVFTWTDGSNAHYPPHSHETLTTHLIRRGSMTITFPEDGDGDEMLEGKGKGKEGEKEKEKGKEKKTYGVGERVDVEAGRVHEVWMGGEGCEYVVGEM